MEESNNKKTIVYNKEWYHEFMKDPFHFLESESVIQVSYWNLHS